MCKKSFFIKFKEEYSERSFNPEETMKWLCINKVITMSWALEEPKSLINKESITGLIFKVDGNYHKGYVMITLGWNDIYKVRFFDFNYNEVKDMLSEVYCDELQEKIDIVIEKEDYYIF